MSAANSITKYEYVNCNCNGGQILFSGPNGTLRFDRSGRYPCNQLSSLNLPSPLNGNFSTLGGILIHHQNREIVRQKEGSFTLILENGIPKITQGTHRCLTEEQKKEAMIQDCLSQMIQTGRMTLPNTLPFEEIMYIHEEVQKRKQQIVQSTPVAIQSTTAVTEQKRPEQSMHSTTSHSLAVQSPIASTTESVVYPIHFATITNLSTEIGVSVDIVAKNIEDLFVNSSLLETEKAATLPNGDSVVIFADKTRVMINQKMEALPNGIFHVVLTERGKTKLVKIQ